jgi:hypothetical protein
MLKTPSRRNRTRIVTALLLGALCFQTACGTLFYPERRGQKEGRIDPVVALLNGIGLLFFLVPGIIAFIVDINSGAIYLPPEEGHPLEPVGFLDPAEMTPERIAAVIREHTGAEVTLTEKDLLVMRIEDAEAIDDLLKTSK